MYPLAAVGDTGTRASERGPMLGEMVGGITKVAGGEREGERGREGEREGKREHNTSTACLPVRTSRHQGP